MLHVCSSELEQATQRFVSAMLQEVELSAEPERLLVNYTIMPDPILVSACVHVCARETVMSDVCAG